MNQHDSAVSHVVIALDPQHADAVRLVTRRLLDVLGLAAEVLPAHPHVTLVAFHGLDRSAVVHALGPAIAAIEPFSVRAHGYGIFCGPEPGSLSLHVPVVRSPVLNRLHGRLYHALVAAGAEVAGHTTPDVWTPHINLADGWLDPGRLATCVGELARRPHPHWNVPVERLLVLGERATPGAARTSLRLGATVVG